MESKKETKVKPIVLTDTETESTYTLEFSRESIKFAEAHGFVIEDVAKYPMTKIPELFFYAFRKNHKNIARDKTDKILERMNGIPNGMIERLGELYALPFEALNIMEEGEERKNSTITIDF